MTYHDKFMLNAGFKRLNLYDSFATNFNMASPVLHGIGTQAELFEAFKGLFRHSLKHFAQHFF